MLVLRVVYLWESSGFRLIAVCKRRNLNVLIVLNFVFFDFQTLRVLKFIFVGGSRL